MGQLGTRAVCSSTLTGSVQAFKKMDTWYVYITFRTFTIKFTAAMKVSF